MTTQNSAMGDEEQVDIFGEEFLRLAGEFKKYMLNAKTSFPDISGKDIWEKLYYSAMVPGIIKFILSHDQQIALVADVDARKGMGERLNKAIFFSTTQPDGQFVKDCIIAELDAASKDYEKLLKQAQNKEK